jgi:hypothetical protein
MPHTRDTQTDIRAAVDAISSHFSSDSGATDATLQGTTWAEHRNRDISADTRGNDTEPPIDSSLDAYLHFSDTHRGSNHIMLGVITFFLLISGVWAFLWYQSVMNIELIDSIPFTIPTTETDELTTLFNQITENNETETAVEQEITLKTDLANALRKEFGEPAVLGTTTTSPITE